MATRDNKRDYVEMLLLSAQDLDKEIQENLPPTVASNKAIKGLRDAVDGLATILVYTEEWKDQAWKRVGYGIKVKP
jgi:hypothetical protein